MEWMYKPKVHHEWLRLWFSSKTQTVINRYSRSFPHSALARLLQITVMKTLLYVEKTGRRHTWNMVCTQWNWITSLNTPALVSKENCVPGTSLEHWFPLPTLDLIQLRRNHRQYVVQVCSQWSGTHRVRAKCLQWVCKDYFEQATYNMNLLQNMMPYATIHTTVNSL